MERAHAIRAALVAAAAARAAAAGARGKGCLGGLAVAAGRLACRSRRGEDRELQRVAFAATRRTRDAFPRTQHEVLEARLTSLANVFVNGHRSRPSPLTSF